jgi:hypothetical protein
MSKNESKRLRDIQTVTPAKRTRGLVGKVDGGLPTGDTDDPHLHYISTAPLVIPEASYYLIHSLRSFLI